MTIVKELKYNRFTKDVDMFLNGQLVGSRATAHEAEQALDEMAYEMLTHGGAATARAALAGEH